MRRGELPPIQVDINKDRIREIASESVRMIHEYLGGEFLYTKDQIMDQVENILKSGRITTQFFLNIGSTAIPDLQLRIDPVRKKALCKSSFRRKVAKLNRFIKIL